jgi:hypothetical protein
MMNKNTLLNCVHSTSVFPTPTDFAPSDSLLLGLKWGNECWNATSVGVRAWWLNVYECVDSLCAWNLSYVWTLQPFVCINITKLIREVWSHSGWMLTFGCICQGTLPYWRIWPIVSNSRLPCCCITQVFCFWTVLYHYFGKYSEVAGRSVWIVLHVALHMITFVHHKTRCALLLRL